MQLYFHGLCWLRRNAGVNLGILRAIIVLIFKDIAHTAEMIFVLTVSIWPVIDMGIMIMEIGV